MDTTEDRITKLEEELAHVSMNNEELSSELIHSAKRIEQLERKIATLESRFSSLEDNIDAPIPNEKPPHW
jgi:SlyX protein